MDYDPLQLGFYKIFAVDGIGEANAHEDFIAKVNVNFRSHEANARLIAAAPELLDALEQCRFALEPYDDIKPRDWVTDRERLRRAHEVARAAIAKATGGDAA